MKLLFHSFCSCLHTLRFFNFLVSGQTIYKLYLSCFSIWPESLESRCECECDGECSWDCLCASVGVHCTSGCGFGCVGVGVAVQLDVNEDVVSVSMFVSAPLLVDSV